MKMHRLPPRWIEIRERRSRKLLCRYDPVRRVIEFQRRKRVSKVEIGAIDTERKIVYTESVDD